MSRRNLNQVLCFVLAIVGSATFACGQTTWLGGSGLWRIDANWSGGMWPQNNYVDGIFYDVSIDGGNGIDSVVFVDNQVWIDSLTLTGGDALRIDDNSFVLVDTDRGGFLHNDGEIILLPGGGLRYGASAGNVPCMLSGSGAITLTSAAERAVLRGASTAGGLRHLINVDSKIQGFGQFTGGGGQVTNQTDGLIVANVDGETLEMASMQDGMLNEGIMRATNGGDLKLTNVPCANQNIIEALDGSTITLGGGGNITGGTLRSVGTGSIEVLGGSINDVILEGNLNHYFGVFPVSGNIDNRAELYLIDSGQLRNNTVTTFSGGGSIILVSTPRVSSIDGSNGEFTNVDNTIRGYGQITVGAFTNESAGIVDSDVGGETLLVNPGNTIPYINQGVFRASNGGNLELSSGAPFENAGGTIEALAGSTVTHSGSVVGGTIRSVDSGKIDVSRFGRITDLSIEGAFDVTGQLTAVGTIESQADIDIIGNGRFVVSSPVILNGTGSINLIDATSQISSTGTLEMNGGSITGIGRVGVTTNCLGTTISPGNSIGKLDVRDDLTLGLGSVVQLEIQDKLTFDEIGIASDALDLNCHLSVDTLGFSPAPSDNFLVIEAGTLTGNFSNVANGGTLITDDGTGKFRVNYGVGSSFDPDHVVLSNYQLIPSIPADMLTVVRGIQTDGTVVDLEESDNQRVTVQRNPSQTTGVVEVELTAATSIQDPASFAFTIESAGFYRSSLVQSIEFWDFDLGQFVEVDSRPVSRSSDDKATAFGAGGLSRFVEDSTGEIRARILFTSPVRRQSFSVSLDQAYWAID